VATNSEPLLPEAREAARKAWGIEISNMWGCVEVGHIGIECDSHQGLHLSDDAIITEVVDADDRPVTDPEAVEKVLVTSLFNRVQPIIRYELTDTAIPAADPCSCGAAYPLISEVRGRADDAFRYPGGAVIHPLLFRTPLGQNPMIEQYQVRQTRRGADITIVTRGSVDRDRLARDIAGALAGAGLPEPQIGIEAVDEIQRHKETGKLKRFIPLGD
jgi:phenylacetate-coenzyme A ligase PaaK-like adenylate-forming protein